MRASLGYEPDGGSCRQAPNVALEEQSGQLPWSQEVRSSNSSLLARLSAARGPLTMPRELMASMLKSGTPHHLSQSAVRFKRRKNKRPRSKVASAQKFSVHGQRAKGRNLPQESGTRLYCELTPEKFPELANKGTQFRLERQLGSRPRATPSGGRQDLHRVWHTSIGGPLRFRVSHTHRTPGSAPRDTRWGLLGPWARHRPPLVGPISQPKAPSILLPD